RRRLVGRVWHAAAQILDDHVFAQFPLRLEPTLREIGPPARGQRPDYFPRFVPVAGNDHAKDKSLTPRIEMRRLTFIIAEVDVVVGPNRDVDFLFVIAIEITKYQIERAVGIVLPPFEYRGDILPAGILNLGANA